MNHIVSKEIASPLRISNFIVLSRNFRRKVFVSSYLFLLFASVILSQTEGFSPYTANWSASANSPASLSFLLDPPAGKYGFIESRGGHTVYPGGRRFRMWGVNMGLNMLFPPKESAPLIADHLSRVGINCVRIHYADCHERPGEESTIDKNRNDTRHLDMENMDRLDYFFAELKKRGIYTYLQITGGRTYKEGDDVKDYDIIKTSSSAIYFDARIRELQKEYARNLLTHVNPYTGLEYRNDPAIVILELVNENSVMDAWLRDFLNGKNTEKRTDFSLWGDMPPSYERDLTNLYNSWLERRLNQGELQELRKLAGVSENKPIPRIRSTESADVPKKRFYLEIQFYMDIERDYFLEMQRYLRDDLGVRALISGTADHDHSRTGYPLVSSLSQLDIVDSHRYWDIPKRSKDPKTGKNIAVQKNIAMVDDPLHSTIVMLSRGAFAGKPFTVSEYNHHFPNDYASEAFPLIASYAAFQDWDGIFLFVLGKEDPVTSPLEMIYDFELSTNTVKMSQLAAGSLLFLRSDVRPAEQTVSRTYSLQQVYESCRMPASEGPYFTPGFPLSIPLIHASRVTSFTGPPTGNYVSDLKSPLISDTKELIWSYGRPKEGLVTVNTLKTQGFIGFCGGNDYSLPNLSINVENPFCSVLLSSLDNALIGESGSLLLSTAGKVANKDMIWNKERTSLINNGKPPTMIEPIRGKVTLHGLKNAKGIRVRAMDPQGKVFGPEIQVKKKGEDWQFTIGEPATVWYKIDVIKKI